MQWPRCSSHGALKPVATERNRATRRPAHCQGANICEGFNGNHLRCAWLAPKYVGRGVWMARRQFVACVTIPFAHDRLTCTRPMASGVAPKCKAVFTDCIRGTRGFHTNSKHQPPSEPQMRRPSRDLGATSSHCSPLARSPSAGSPSLCSPAAPKGTRSGQASPRSWHRDSAR